MDPGTDIPASPRPFGLGLGSAATGIRTTLLSGVGVGGSQFDYVVRADTLASKVNSTQLKKPEFNSNDFFGQRDKQRKWLFRFAIGMSISSLVFLVAMVGFQAVMRAMGNADFEVLSDTGLQIIAVAIFGQIFGVVYVIANSLWSNAEFNFMTSMKDK